MIQDLHHLGLTVRDVEASARWYEQVLGFQHVGGYESPDGLGARCSCAIRDCASGSA